MSGRLCSVVPDQILFFTADDRFDGIILRAAGRVIPKLRGNSFTAQKRQRPISGDAGKPRPKLRNILQARQLFPRGDKCFLTDIFAACEISHNAVGHGAHQILVTSDNVAKGFTGLRPGIAAAVPGQLLKSSQTPSSVQIVQILMKFGKSLELQIMADWEVLPSGCKSQSPGDTNSGRKPPIEGNGCFLGGIRQEVSVRRAKMSLADATPPIAHFVTRRSDFRCGTEINVMANPQNTLASGATPPEERHIDKLRIEAAVREILLAVGENPDRDGLKGHACPRRPHVCRTVWRTACGSRSSSAPGL